MWISNRVGMSSRARENLWCELGRNLRGVY